MSLFLVPSGSSREAAVDQVIRTFQVLKQEGVAPFLHAIVHRLSVWSRLRKHGLLFFQVEEKRRKFSAGVYHEIPPTNSYDVLVFPIIDWNFRFQRP